MTATKGECRRLLLWEQQATRGTTAKTVVLAGYKYSVRIRWYYYEKNEQSIIKFYGYFNYWG